jgi:nifR3 family TIM-barrel protein
MAEELKPFQIGDVQVAGPVVLAALAGYSDLAYRRICRQMGAPLCATEMMLDRSLLTRGKLQTRLVASDEDDHPVVGQIVGNDPETMGEAGRILDDRGFDVIDLNFACPVRKALRRRRGGWLMSDPARAVAISRAVVDAVSRPVTLKLRRRFADGDTDENFWQIARGALDVGVAGLCVHARSVEQKYGGRADWSFIREVRQAFPDATIMGSGDVRDAASAIDMLRQTGVDAVTAARGAIGNPWIFRQVEDLAAGREPYHPTLQEQAEVMLEHMAGSVALYGPKKGSAHMRKFGIKYARMHHHPKQLRMAFVNVKRPEQWHEVLRHRYLGEGT